MFFKRFYMLILFQKREAKFLNNNQKNKFRKNVYNTIGETLGNRTKQQNSFDTLQRFEAGRSNEVRFSEILLFCCYLLY